MSDRKNPNKPPHRAQSLRHLAESVERTKRILARWPNTAHVDMGELATNLGSAQTLLRGVAKKLDSLPVNYPPRRISASALIKPGATVAVKDQYRNKYELLIPGAELEALHVEAVNDHALTFKTKSGIVSLIPKRHVKVVEVAAPKEVEA